MRGCAARFEIDVDDLDAALDEVDGLREVQGVLQDATHDYLFTPWSGNLSEPWPGVVAL